MTDTYIHNIRVAADAQRQSSRGQSANIATDGVLDDDLASVEALSLDPDERRLEATIRGTYAEKVAGELEAVFTGSGFSTLAVYSPTGDSSGLEGYFVFESGSLERASMHDDRVQSVEATLRREGTRASHYRRVRVNPTPVVNDFGSDSTAYIGIPGSASLVTWFDRASKAREAVSVVETRTGEGGDVYIVDATDVSLTAPYELVYNVPYAGEHPVGVVAWDTRGHASKHDADGVLQWAKTYRTTHEYSGVPVVDTGLLRLYLDTSNGLAAEEYTSGSWSAVSLPASDWQLSAVDVTAVQPMRVEAQLTFENTSTSEVASVLMVARRGATTGQFLRVADSATPAGLATHLDPVASGSDVVPEADRGLIARSELREFALASSPSTGGQTAEAGQMQYGHESYGGS